MKPKDFSREVCIRLLELYKEELGGFGVDRYLENPEILYFHVQNPRRWLSRIEYERIGSRFSEDTKLGFQLSEQGDLEMVLYLNPGSGRNTPEEQAIEDRFIRRTREILPRSD